MQDLDTILQQVHILAEGNIDYPVSGEDDYEMRKVLANKWVRSWENEEGIVWDELWTEGTKTTIASTASYDLSISNPDFKQPGGWVRLTGPIYYPVLKTKELALLADSYATYVYFTGSVGTGYTLKFNANAPPTSSGSTITFPYYKSATQFTTGTTKTEMSDPDFIIHGVVSDVLSLDDPDESQKNFEIAQAKLRGMKTRNTMAPWYTSNTIPDLGTVVGRGGFGN